MHDCPLADAFPLQEKFYCCASIIPIPQNSETETWDAAYHGLRRPRRPRLGGRALLASFLRQEMATKQLLETVVTLA
jgi:hypothetical protein